MSTQARAEATEADDETEQALELMREGGKHFAAGEYEEARDAFERSYQLHPAFEGACSLGQTYARLGRMAKAAFYYGECVGRFPHGGDRDKLKMIRADQAEILKKVGRVRISAEAELAVEIDGEPAGTTPLEGELYVEPGEHLLLGRRSDGAESSERFVVAGGELLRVKLADVKLPSDVAAPREAQPVQEPQSEVPEKRQHNWVPAYVLGGVSVAALAGGIVLRVAAGNNKADAEELHSRLGPGDCAGSGRLAECDKLDSLANSQRSLGIAADVTLITGGVFAGATLGWIVYELARPTRAKGGAMKAAPLLDVNAKSAWIGLRGQF